jgi:acetyltransferase-like isoleucine patch superfamily enzyme
MQKFLHLLLHVWGVASSAFWTAVARARLAAHGAKVGRRLRVTGPLLLRIHPEGVLVIGDDCTLHSGFAVNPVGGALRLSIWVGRSGSLLIGDNVGISNATLVAMAEVRVGDDVRIGGGASVYDTDFHSLDLASRLTRPDTGVRTAPVLIRRGAFVGAFAIILKGSVMGESAILGAGAVLSGKVPSSQIWAGNPARYIRQLIN